jgi:hypothetical protein
MLPDDIRSQIENITAGNVIPGGTDHCTAIRNLLCAGATAGRTVKVDFESKQRIKKAQALFLEQYAEDNGLWLEEPVFVDFLARGGEASVYFAHDHRHVLKINDGGYYATWLEYFDSLCLHNILFSNTAYTLEHFTRLPNPAGEMVLHVVVRQRFIISDRSVELSEIRAFLEHNGFVHTRRNDFSHPDVSLILEDMHDENVLVQEDALFFIDTVFYIDRPL